MSKDFTPKDKYIDPLNLADRIEYSKKFIDGSIFREDFITQENHLSIKTIVFDLDETMRGWDIKNHQTFLRHSLKQVLGSLKDLGYRLVVWSAADRDSIQQTLNKYPEFEQYFNLIIPAESYSFKFVLKSEQDYIKKVDEKYYQDLLKTSQDNIDPSTGRSIYRIPKNIKLLGYSLIIDDDPAVLKEAVRYDFKALRIFPYKYDNPDSKNIFPSSLGKIIDQDFGKNLIKYITSEIENTPRPKESVYLIGE
ncbi:MAG: HAD-IIIC family phosphatase [bacterium]|nr:HAD-IIIC family phosphatase [bacterium]